MAYSGLHRSDVSSGRSCAASSSERTATSLRCSSLRVSLLSYSSIGQARMINGSIIVPHRRFASCASSRLTASSSHTPQSFTTSLGWSGCTMPCKMARMPCQGRCTSASSSFVAIRKSAGKRSPPASSEDSSTSNAAELRLLGFTAHQTNRVIDHFKDSASTFSIEHVSGWAKLLTSHGINSPTQVLSDQPFAMERWGKHIPKNAAAVMMWLASRGMTPVSLSNTVSNYPMVFQTPLATLQAAVEWARQTLAWSDSMINSTLERKAGIFCSSIENNLAPKLAWWLSHGVSTQRISKAFLTSPALLNSSIASYENNLSALQSLGFTPSEAADAARKQPNMLTHSLAKATVLEKVHFLTHDMGQAMEGLALCPVFLTLSIFHNIGPRWAFYTLHIKDKPFVLGTQLKCSPGVYALRLHSPSLKAAREVTGLTNLQLYLEFKLKWQQGDGKKFFREEKKRRGEIELVEDLSEDRI